jgi:TolA-binding protein
MAGMDTSADPGAVQDNSAESFLTPDLFSNMQSEIDQLQTIAGGKERELQAARGELRDVDTRMAATETTSSIRKTPGGATRQRVSAPPMADVDGETNRQYQAALDDYYSRNYDGAIDKFATMLGRNDNNSLADNCQYWIGESYYAKGDFYQAAAEFHKVYTFSDGNKQDDAQLMIGLSFLKAGEKSLAMREFAEVMTYSKNQASMKRAERFIRQLEQA